MELGWLIVIGVALLLLGWAGIHLVAAIKYWLHKRKVLKPLRKSLDKPL